MWRLREKIFIAKNLIENVGGTIEFSNSLDNSGSVVEIVSMLPSLPCIVTLS